MGRPAGPPPAAVGSAAAVSVALRAYTEALADVTLYNNLRAALTSQILTAVNASFLSALEDPDFGFGDVTPLAMLSHLRTEYGTMTPEELEHNRAALSEPWNFVNLTALGSLFSNLSINSSSTTTH
jgi:hypothetical protein